MQAIVFSVRMSAVCKSRRGCNPLTCNQQQVSCLFALVSYDDLLLSNWNLTYFDLLLLVFVSQFL